MEVYLVGGAVRDLMMGIEPKDRDYVVIGETPESMTQAGFKQVGADFPVFLHPETGEEYALARTERKSGYGYHGFTTDHSPRVTLEEDLLRRDLTINSMAMDAHGNLIDPYFGRVDLEDGILKHTSEAFREDPVRILRTARFAARYNFDVAPNTMTLMRGMIKIGEFDHLTPERVWVEFEKGLKEDSPGRMFAILAQCGALKKIPVWDVESTVPLIRARAVTESFNVRVASLFTGVSYETFLANRIPTDIAEIAVTADQISAYIENIQDTQNVDRFMDMIRRTDYIRRPDRFWAAVLSNTCKGVMVPRNVIWALHDVAAVNAGSIALSCLDKSKIKETVHAARVAAIVHHF